MDHISTLQFARACVATRTSQDWAVLLDVCLRLFVYIFASFPRDGACNATAMHEAFIGCISDSVHFFIRNIVLDDLNCQYAAKHSLILSLTIPDQGD